MNKLINKLQIESNFARLSILFNDYSKYSVLYTSLNLVELFRCTELLAWQKYRECQKCLRSQLLSLPNTWHKYLIIECPTQFQMFGALKKKNFGQLFTKTNNSWGFLK